MVNCKYFEFGNPGESEELCTHIDITVNKTCLMFRGKQQTVQLARRTLSRNISGARQDVGELW